MGLGTEIDWSLTVGRNMTLILTLAAKQQDL
jgi:hypothetical protein